MYQNTLVNAAKEMPIYQTNNFSSLQIKEKNFIDLNQH